MSETLHFIVTEDSGRTFRLPFSKTKFFLLSAGAGLALTGLVAAASFSLQLFSENRAMENKLAQLEQQVANSDKLVAAIQLEKKEENQELSQQVADLELTKAQQEASFEEERQQLLSSAVNDLKERSDVIEQIMDGIGIKVSGLSNNSSTANSGGPYIAYPEEDVNQLILRADKYIDTFNKLPIGKPIIGKITSYYGPRKDPFNRNSAFHAGTDFRGKVGTTIVATGDGVVEKSYYNRTYGNYVLINHGNGYKTAYAHMNKLIAKKGQRIQRGDAVGTLGNTGRSTGPHLHYEILLNNKPINPKKFLAVKLPDKKRIAATTKKISHV